jgi:hypothetical protein
MSNWDDFRRDETPRAVQTGKQRCVIVAAEEAVSQSSKKPMIVVTVTPSGSTTKVKHYIVKNDYFNRRMTDFFDAFPEIGSGNFNFVEWIGAVGAANFGIDDNGYLTVKWFINPKQAENLPEWEGEKPQKQSVSKLLEADDDVGDLPF